jgi:crotonobetainyl-CoA:carnitine CoA-transferase CaiB-like acyl-CoA transferase
LKDNVGRVKNEPRIDAALAEWTGARSSHEILQQLSEAEVPAGPINSIADIADDPHFQQREAFEEITVGAEKRLVPAVYPRLQRTPGSTDNPGPDHGEHTDQVLKSWLGATDAEVRQYRTKGIV